jgi:predicted TIM-barrel fold metal-dependent hydrolase
MPLTRTGSEWGYYSRVPAGKLPAFDASRMVRSGRISRGCAGKSSRDACISLGEIGAVYAGVSPADPRFEPYFALGAELGIPVGIHTGAGPPRHTIDCACPNFNHEFGNPALLEPVLARHPGLRLFLMHAGGPRFLDETIAVMTRHRSVYADLSAIALAWPQDEFNQWIRDFVDAGLESRLFFGSDAVFSLDETLKVFERVPFLTEAQKDAMLYTNAARFLA